MGNLRWYIALICLIAVLWFNYEIRSGYLAERWAEDEAVSIIAAHPQAICRVNTGGKKLVALTLDDGPDPRYTPKILDILKRYRINATFFVVGRNARAHPSLVKRMVNEGHTVQNHTYTHPYLEKCTEKFVIKEILNNQIVIEQLTMQKPQYFRPPRGLLNEAIVRVARLNGYKIVLWTVAVENSALRNPQDVVALVLARAEPGAIILAHDGRLNRERTVAVLPLIIEGYLEQGYCFVTLEELVLNQTLSASR